MCWVPGSDPNTANCDTYNLALTNKGSYTESRSPWGTFDQGGNVAEWNEQILSATYRGMRGGAWDTEPYTLAANDPIVGFPRAESDNVGFRVARIDALPQCMDGADNDGDGGIDFAAGPGNDPGCASASDLDERDPTLVCDDGIDNDGDGFTDYPADPACQTGTFDREDAQCQDGVDDDGDGLIDFDGGASRNGGIALTALDPQCAGKPWRNNEAPNRCGLGFELGLALPFWRLARRRSGRPS